jgi:hypothetical protein
MLYANRAVYEIMRESMVQPDGPQMTSSDAGSGSTTFKTSDGFNTILTHLIYL